MAFDATINLGSILTAIGMVGGAFWAYHRWEARIEIRHVENQAEFDKLNGKIDRVENKVDETRKDVNGSHQKLIDLDRKVERHLAADDIIQRELARRLERMEEK